MPRKLVTGTPVLSLSAYASGDNVGGLFTFDNALGADNKGLMRGFLMVDKAKQNASLSIVFFGATPSESTITDNSAPTVVDADLLKVIGVHSIASGNYTSFADSSFASSVGLNIPLESSSKTIYALMITTSTPTYAAADDIVVKLYIDV